MEHFPISYSLNALSYSTHILLYCNRAATLKRYRERYTVLFGGNKEARISIVTNFSILKHNSCKIQIL